MSSPDATMTAAGAAESVGGGEAVGMPSLRQAASGLAAALGQGTTVAREAGRLGAELTRIARGRSSVAPARGDRRFADPAWTSNMAFRMIQQSYLASAQALDRIVAAMPDGRSGILAEQAQFAASIVASAAAPTNFLMSNPAALKRAFDTGGMSLAWGARNFAHDVRLLTRPGRLRVLGTPLRLPAITVPTFVTGAVTDHLTPWKGCYRTTQLLGRPSTFVLSYSGHIASLVNPPGNPKAHYWTGGVPGEDPEQWLAGAEKQQGSWWEAWAEWATARSGDRRPRPGDLGGERYPVLSPAPGLYVRDLVPTR